MMNTDQLIIFAHSRWVVGPISKNYYHQQCIFVCPVFVEFGIRSTDRFIQVNNPTVYEQWAHLKSELKAHNILGCESKPDTCALFFLLNY